MSGYSGMRGYWNEYGTTTKQYPTSRMDMTFLVSRRGLACQREISLALAKTLPIHYYTIMDTVFSNYAG